MQKIHEKYRLENIMIKGYKDITLNSLPERELEIVGAITVEKMSLMRQKALNRLKESVEIAGFRKGNVPDAILVQKVGEMRILEEAAEMALSEEYPNILEEHHVDAIGRPEISITKMAPRNPLEFKIKTALMPEVSLTDYKKIASSISLTETESNKTYKADATTEKDKRRIGILEKIMSESTIDLPKIIVEGEMEKMLAQFKDDIGKSGISFEDYLKRIKKTENDLRMEWKDTAIKRAKSQVILNTIAKEENIVPKEEDVKKEMENILVHHKDADRFRVRMYVETFLTNELVFQFLEKC
ncbi:MAG: hypothetical protein A3C63_01315 [Candidatus Zambryskibacteria bacterium RIFCSPHIGHO2_02_FULL_39_82]|uniref:Trigger factor n=2 Tax=Candidatus Zambryskiibacteriota TaxID=1817925 RepID=A0A1G2UWQ9_9BACT|nr:MAG: hypothetical protein A3C63_01315 [Candidatus Zambryskibacteria bacterium RIFCSPHIGHO2_02_FULL_39_82]OHB13796.1 MAG: hypothetical protein A2Y49_01635 [Candidatus Zambryskibacteria bacterium RIFCSPLOWO2_12_39_8]